MARYKDIPNVPPAHPVFQNGIAFSKDPLPFIEKNHKIYGDIYRISFGIYDLIMLHNVDDIQHVFQKNHKNYQKSKGYEKLSRAIGRGLLTSEGEFWKKHRRIAQPAFHKQSLGKLSHTIYEESLKLIEGWKEKAETGKTFRLLDETMSVTCDIVSKSLFSADVSNDLKQVQKSIGTFIDLAMPLMTNPLVMPKWIPTQLNRDLNSAMDFIDDIMYRIIKERRQQSEVTKKDLLDLLMYTEDEETGHCMTDLQLKDEAVILFLAGHETSANALAFAIYQIENHTEVKQKMLAEIETVFKDGELDLSAAARMPYMQQIIDETLRLYPPAWVLGRRSIGPDELSNTKINGKQNVLVSVYSIHRDERYWDDPEAFIPERFTPEKKKSYHNYQYFPFGGGPRLCIGNTFALMEMKILLSLIFKNFEIDVLTKQLELSPRLTLRPEDGIQIRVKNK